MLFPPLLKPIIIVALILVQFNLNSQEAISNYFNDYYSLMNNAAESYDLDDKDLFKEEIIQRFYARDKTIIENYIFRDGSEVFKGEDYLDFINVFYSSGFKIQHEIEEIDIEGEKLTVLLKESHNYENRIKSYYLKIIIDIHLINNRKAIMHGEILSIHLSPNHNSDIDEDYYDTIWNYGGKFQGKTFRYVEDDLGSFKRLILLQAFYKMKDSWTIAPGMIIMIEGNTLSEGLIDSLLQNLRKTVSNAVHRTLLEELPENYTVPQLVLKANKFLEEGETSEYDCSEKSLNACGYYLMEEEQNEYALKIFRLNTELYPNAYNTFDSLGECLVKMGRIEEGKEAYEHSLMLNPKSESGIKVLKELESK